MQRKEYRLHRRRSRATGEEIVYCYHVVTGKRLPLPGSPGFDVALAKARVPDAPGMGRGTVSDLVSVYRGQPEYRNIRPATRRLYDKAFRVLEDKLGNRPAVELTRSDIRELRNVVSHSPATANQLVGTVKTLWRFAFREELVPKPIDMSGLMMKVGHWGTWQPDDIAKFLSTGHSRHVFLGFVLGLYTGQRLGDVLAMTWAQFDEGNKLIRLTQSKTGKPMWVPCHRDLHSTLRVAKRAATSDFIVHKPSGQPVPQRDWSGHYFPEAKRKAGLPSKGLPFHGLRKASANMLREAGSMPFQVAAVLGHSSLDMVRLYTAEADQMADAEAAIRMAESANGRFSPVRQAVEEAVKSLGFSQASA